MFICRPCLTIIAFRCIEQIIHQLWRHNHCEEHSPRTARKLRLYSEMDIVKIEHDIEVEIKYDIFSNMSALDYVLYVIGLVFLCIFDLLTITKHNHLLICQIANGVWCVLYIIMAVWTFMVFRFFSQINDKEITLKRFVKDIMRHLALLISLCGVLVSDVAAFGIEDRKHYIMETSLAFNMIFGIMQFALLVYLNELNINVNRDSFPRYIKRYGKIIVGVHIALIVHCFLYEAYHLEETIHHAHKFTLWSTMEFISFFWNIEFHLGCIERINFIKKTQH